MCIQILEVADIETWGAIFLRPILIRYFYMFYGTEGREVAVEMILDSQ